MNGGTNRPRDAGAGSAAVLHALPLIVALLVPAFAVGDAARAAGAGVTEFAAALARWTMLLGNTALVCVLAASVSLVLGGALALLVTRWNLPGRRLVAAAGLLGACLPLYVAMVAVFALVPTHRLAGSTVACGVLYGLVFSPLAGLVLGTVFRAADPDVEEHGLLDATAGQVLRRIMLPQARAGVAVAGLLVVWLVATDYTITDLLVVRTLAEEVYTQFALDRRHAGPLLTGLPLLVLSALLLILLQRRGAWLGEQTGGRFDAPPRRFALGRGRWAAGAAAWLLVAVLVGLPLWALLRHVGPVANLWPAAWNLRPELTNSALLAAAGATLCVLPAPGLAWLLSRGRCRWLLSAGVVAVLATPAPVVGISLIALLNRPALGWLYDSPAVVAAGYFVRFLPLAVLLLLPGIRRIPAEFEAAARVDGSGWWRTHWHVRLPALRRDAAVAWLVVAILAFGEIGTTVLVVPPGCDLAAVRAFTLLHFGVYRDLAVLALLAGAAILLPWAGLLVLLKAGTKRV